ncbi:MAG: carbohydrate ABC transporter permease [Spirochaetae bacterium HGW-Spirochaetae-8]|nr:MAG: carbohydrate ABC transporter permease [Spirochaetae bacterium HGW-Spirochaetae-8]
MRIPLARRNHLVRRKPLTRAIELLLIAAWIFPLVWLFLTSIQLESDVVTSTLRLLPANPTWGNYAKAFGSTEILQWIVNSVIVATVTMTITLVIDAPIAYAFAKIQFPGKNILFWAVMAGMMVPFQVLIIPLYQQFNTYGLIDTLTGALLPRLAVPVGIFILKQFFEGIPSVLEEAAFIDGANRYRIFATIIMPLGKAAVATVVILSFINAWNDFLWPLVVINDTLKYTITVGIANFQGTHGTDYALIMSGALIASVPQFVFYAFFRKKIIAGIAMTGIKG